MFATRRVSFGVVGRVRGRVAEATGVGGRAHQAHTGWRLVHTAGVWGQTHTHTQIWRSRRGGAGRGAHDLMISQDIRRTCRHQEDIE